MIHRSLPLLLVLSLPGVLIGCQQDKKPATTQTAPGPSSPSESGASSSESEPADAHSVNTEPSDSELEEADAVTEPGVHHTDKGTALAFRPGMSLHETRKIIRDAVAKRQLEVTLSKRETRPLRDGEIEVLVEELKPRSDEIASFRLTHFEDVLVSIVVNYAQPDRARIRALTERHGEATRNKGWVGWWDREQGLIVQASPDGSSYEVFDLMAARKVFPDIDLVMLESWRRRYVQPPPWGRDLANPVDEDQP